MKDHPIRGDADALPALGHARRAGIVYRPMTDADLPFLTALYRSTREAELARTPWDAAEKLAFIEMQFRAQHLHYRAHYPQALWLIVMKDGDAIGRLYLDRQAREHRIIDIALLPQHRGAGIGGAILRDLMDEAAAAARPVTIHVETMNPAMTLYRRLGFVTVADKGVYHLLQWPAPD